MDALLIAVALLGFGVLVLGLFLPAPHAPLTDDPPTLDVQNHRGDR